MFDKIHIIDNVAFVAQCGWWDYKFGEPTVHQNISRNAFIKAFSVETVDKIYQEAVIQSNWLAVHVSKLQHNNNIEKIVVITHSLPHPDMISWDIYPECRNNVGNYGNSMYRNVFSADEKNKIKLWAFGHNHDSKDKTLGSIRMVSNPRGRPKDFNRTTWTQITVEI